jgi:hypothetical protein
MKTGSLSEASARRLWQEVRAVATLSQARLRGDTVPPDVLKALAPPPSTLARKKSFQKPLQGRPSGPVGATTAVVASVSAGDPARGLADVGLTVRSVAAPTTVASLPSMAMPRHRHHRRDVADLLADLQRSDPDEDVRDLAGLLRGRLLALLEDAESQPPPIPPDTIHG